MLQKIVNHKTVMRATTCLSFVIGESGKNNAPSFFWRLHKTGPCYAFVRQRNTHLATQLKITARASYQNFTKYSCATQNKQGKVLIPSEFMNF
jgi:hypothetical protein